MMIINAGISLGTMRSFLDPIGLQSKDCYVLFRPIFEGMLNGAYVLAAPSNEAERALRHAQQKEHRMHDAELTFGPFLVCLKSGYCDENIKKTIRELTGPKGGEKSWTDKTLQYRIEQIAEKYGNFIYLTLGAPLLMTYPKAAERTHSTLYGTLSYMGVEDKSHFYRIMINDMIDCVSASAMCVIGLLNIMYQESDIYAFKTAEDDLADMTEQIVETVGRNENQ